MKKRAAILGCSPLSIEPYPSPDAPASNMPSVGVVMAQSPSVNFAVTVMFLTIVIAVDVSVPEASLAQPTKL